MHQPFSTAFVRPASFRFEFSRRRIVTGTISRSTFGRAPDRTGQNYGGREGWDRFIGWKEGEVEKAWWPRNSNEEKAPLEGTLLGFGSLSSGAALTIPSLLFPDLFRG